MDLLLDDLEKAKSVSQKKVLYKKAQLLFHEYQPVTFLYWLDVKTAYNSRLENIKINPLGAIQHCWDWRLAD